MRDNEDIDRNLVQNPQRLPDEIRIIDTRAEVEPEMRSRIITRQEAIDLMDATGLDLYVVSPEDAPPPVVLKLLDYGKFRFEQQKKKREMEKKQRQNTRTLKEFYFGPQIGDHDIDVKIAHIKQLIGDHDIKIAVKLNRHNKFIITNRNARPLDRAIRSEDFVLQRVLKSLAAEISPTRMELGEKLVYATLRPKA